MEKICRLALSPLNTLLFTMSVPVYVGADPGEALIKSIGCFYVGVI